jgi:hypothetical protein
MNISSVCWSPDGKRLATGSEDGTAKVWETTGARELLTLKGHASEVVSVCWSPDGKRLATGGADGTAKVWETTGGAEVLTLKDHKSAVESMAWPPDGKRLATGSQDGTAKVWEAATPSAVQEWARQDRTLEKLWTMNAFRGRHAEGFIQKWLLLLPFPYSGESGEQALDQQQLGGEAQLRPRQRESVRVGDKQLVWQEYCSPEAVLDFDAVLGQVKEWSVAYAACYLESDRERNDLWLQVLSDDQAKVYLNGKEIYQYRWNRWLTTLDTVGPVVLKQGTNVLLFKVVNESQDWRGCLRFVDRSGRPVQDLQVRLTPE